MSKYEIWKNWSGSVLASPEEILYPHTIEDVQNIIKKANKEHRKIRIVGSGHSFTPIVATNQLLISLDHMQGIIEVDDLEKTATVWAGTKLHKLGALLHEKNLAQVNLGDIDVQSIAGAISTGTHGTGIKFGNVSTQVIAITAVLGTGEVLECSTESHPETFKAMQISLGLLGIIVKVKLKLQSSYVLKLESRRLPLEEVCAQLDTWVDENRNFEFFWFPYATMCQVKTLNITTYKPKEQPIKSFFNDTLLENTIFGLLSEGSRVFPKMSKAVSQLSASFIPNHTKVNYSYRLFTTQRLIKFQEMEYNVPAEAMAQIIAEMREVLEKEKFNVHFPVECRYAAPDDIWLSPAYGRPSGYIAVHMYRGMPYKQYFAKMERIFVKYGGRPHWGKLHTRTEEDLVNLYPMWKEFKRVRAECDPNQLFVNSYLKQLFNI